MSLIDFDTYPINEVIPYLLKDKTNGENIIFATTQYAEVAVCTRWKTMPIMI